MFILLFSLACQKPVSQRTIYPEIRINAVEIPDPTVETKEEEQPVDSAFIADLEQKLTEFSKLKYGSNDDENARKIRVEKWKELEGITLPDFNLRTLAGKYVEYTAVVALGAIAEMRWVEMALRYPVPRFHSRFEQMIFQEELIRFVDELRLGAKSKLELLVNLELQSGRRGRYPLMALKELQRLEPIEYPSPPHVSGSEMDALSQWLQLQDRSVFQPVIMWPEKTESRQKLVHKLKAAERQKNAWTTACRGLLDELVHLEPNAFHYCLGRNASSAALSTALSDEAQLQSSEEVYWKMASEALDALKPGGFWHRQLLTEHNLAKRKAAKNRHVRGDGIRPIVDNVDPIWLKSSPIRSASPNVLLHRQLHGIRIHYRMERFIKGLRRLSANPAEVRRSFRRELIETLDNYERDAKRLLTLYPESREFRDKLLYSIGSANLKYAESLLSHSNLFPSGTSEFILDRVAERELHGHRLLLLCRDRPGDRSKWSEKSDVELRFHFPESD